MKFKKIFLLFIFILLSCCNQYDQKNSKKLEIKIDKKYRNSGFALIYNENLNIKKLEDKLLNIFHGNLKKRSLVKITNPNNGKSLIAEVKSNRVNFSKFYNSIISKRIAETLEVDPSEPFVELTLVTKDSTFVVQKARTFEEEKEVAEKAPIDGIKISNLNADNNKKKKNSSKKNFLYSIKIADFYYKKTAQLMINRIVTETSLKKPKIQELSKNNYRVLIGPFNDINLLKNSFEKMNSLYFENMEIIRND